MRWGLFAISNPMPIQVPVATRRLSQDEFGAIAYRFVEHAFKIHDQFGRFFDESIYQHEMVARMDGALIEVPLTVSHRTFEKTYYLDLLEVPGGLFELKCVEAIHARHRAQLTSYLLMMDLAHGKIINFRPTKVEHEFVNCNSRLAEQKTPRVVRENWQTGLECIEAFETLLRELIADWGIGLGTDLYTEAINHLLGRQERVMVNGSKGDVGTQVMSLLTSDTAFKITSMTKHIDEFRLHATRLLNQTRLQRILWANMTIGEVRFEMIGRG